MNQAALPFDWPADRRETSFIVTPSNADAVRHLTHPATWPVAISILVGPRQSGRSLLARQFAGRGGTALDDAERRDERALFAAWNAAQASRVPLLLVADAPPPAWAITLADLRSRLNATPIATLGAPDDDLIARLLVRLLERRGVTVGFDVTGYVVPRIPRTHHAVVALADALDAASLAQRRPITIPLVRDTMAAVFGGGVVTENGGA